MRVSLALNLHAHLGVDMHLDQSDAARAKDMDALRKRLTSMPLLTRKAPDPHNSIDLSESDGEVKPCKRVSFFCYTYNMKTCLALTDPHTLRP